MFGLKNSNWKADAIDWIGDAIEAIGYHCGFDEKRIRLQVNNYRVRIPSEIESINYIRYNGRRLPLGVDKSDYGFVNIHNQANPNIIQDVEEQQLNKLINNLDALRQLDPATPGVLDQISNTLFQINTILGTSYIAAEPFFWRGEFYNIESEVQYIKTSFEEGVIDVYCRAFRVDENGLPLVVNTYKYKECISWFIMGRLILQGYPHPELKSYMEVHEYWEDRLLPQAQNEPKIFSIDEMERFKNRWTSVKRDASAAHIDYIGGFYY